MSTLHRTHRGGFGLAALGYLMAVLAAGGAAAQVETEPLDRPQPHPLALNPAELEAEEGQGLRVDPARVTFHTPGARAEVRVLRNGERVSTDRINILGAFAGGSNYARMFDLRTGDQPGSLIIQGREDMLEIGTYDVRVQAHGEEAVVTVHAPLDELPDTLEREAERRGMDVAELRRELGLSRPGPREHLSISLPSHFYEGQILSISLGHEPGRRFTWFIDGEVVLEGVDAGRLTYPLEEPGAYTLRVEEHRNDHLVASWEGGFDVAEMPAAEWTVSAGREFTISAPEGYAGYTWYADGREVGQGRTLTHTFEQPGVHRLECVADPSAGDAAWAYRRIRWNVEVSE